jgi:hypothetical protein
MIIERTMEFIKPRDRNHVRNEDSSRGLCGGATRHQVSTSQLNGLV